MRLRVRDLPATALDGNVLSRELYVRSTCAQCRLYAAFERVQI
jgi:hypothetical protein